MCGRFVFYSDRDDVALAFNVRSFLATYKQNYNVAPQQTIPALVQHDDTLALDSLKWGLQVGKITMINTRVETLEKLFFGKMDRCVILANGFYEWKNKEPRFITLKDRSLFGMAGIMHEKQCSIITTTPNTFMKSIHERMPVIIPKGKEQQWITSTSTELLMPSKESMSAIKVSTMVNSPKNNSPSCIKAI